MPFSLTLSLLLAIPSTIASNGASLHAHTAHELDARGAYAELQAGNRRFVAGNREYPRQDLARRARLAEGQKPHAIVLTCSDSRLPPELIFDQGLGELFVVRTAGAVADSVEIASIEYAIAVLGARLVVVLGHSHCGAVGAAISTPIGSSAGSKHLDHLVELIRPNIAHLTIDKTDNTYVLPVKANISGVAKYLHSHSDIIRNGVDTREVMLTRGIYHLGSGKVGFWP